MGDDRGSSSHCSGRQGLCLSFSGWHADAAGAGAGRAAGALDVVADDAVLGVVVVEVGRERGDGGAGGRGEVDSRGRGAADGVGVERVLKQRLAARGGRVAVDARVEERARGITDGDAREIADRAEGGRAVVI